MEGKYEKIILDYQNCIKMPTCGECEAWKHLEKDSKTTWCEFLRKRDEMLYDRISEALGR